MTVQIIEYSPGKFALVVSPVSATGGIPDINIKQIGGTNQTGRDITQDTKALTDDTIKGILRSIGDAGATPSNATGQTLLNYQSSIQLRFFFFDAETLTTTPLGGGATFNSATKDLTFQRIRSVGVNAFADQASGANGFIVQGSIDGTNWDTNLVSLSVIASTGSNIFTNIATRFIRVSYTNGGAAQGVFRLGSRYTLA